MVNRACFTFLVSNLSFRRTKREPPPKKKEYSGFLLSLSYSSHSFRLAKKTDGWRVSYFLFPCSLLRLLSFEFVFTRVNSLFHFFSVIYLSYLFFAFLNLFIYFFYYPGSSRNLMSTLIREWGCLLVKLK